MVHHGYLKLQKAKPQIKGGLLYLAITEEIRTSKKRNKGKRVKKRQVIQESLQSPKSSNDNDM